MLASDNSWDVSLFKGYAKVGKKTYLFDMPKKVNLLIDSSSEMIVLPEPAYKSFTKAIPTTGLDCSNLKSLPILYL